MRVDVFPVELSVEFRRDGSDRFGFLEDEGEWYILVVLLCSLFGKGFRPENLRVGIGLMPGTKEDMMLSIVSTEARAWSMEREAKPQHPWLRCTSPLPTRQLFAWHRLSMRLVRRQRALQMKGVLHKISIKVKIVEQGLSTNCAAPTNFDHPMSPKWNRERGDHFWNHITYDHDLGRVRGD